MHDWGERDPAWRGIRSATVWVLGRPVHLLRCEGEVEAGPPQLLVHGLGGSSRNWLDVIVPLSRHGEVAAVDLPGFGTTLVPVGGTARLRANAGFLAALLDTLEWPRTTLHGGSMGGLLATLLASRQPERVARLVLVNPALPAPRRHMLRVNPQVLSRLLPAAVPGFGRLLLEMGMRWRTAEQLVDDSLARVFAEVTRLRPAMRRILLENMIQTQRQPWRRTAMVQATASLIGEITRARGLNHAVDRVVAPTLLIWADIDRLVSAHVISGLRKRRPDWRHHVFTGVGHTPMVEVPDAYVEVVADFYREAEGIAGPSAASVGHRQVHHQSS